MSSSRTSFSKTRYGTPPPRHGSTFCRKTYLYVANMLKPSFFDILSIHAWMMVCHTASFKSLCIISTLATSISLVTKSRRVGYLPWFPQPTVYDGLCISHTPGPIFHGRYLHSWNSGSPKRSALETSRRELSENVSFGIGTLLVAEQSSLENRLRGVWYTPSYMVLTSRCHTQDKVQRIRVYRRSI